MKTVFLFFTLCLTVMAETETEESGNVVFWKDEVTLTCPYDPATWVNKIGWNSPSHTLKYTADVKGVSTCKLSEDKKYYFYIKGYACSDCYELDGTLVVGIIIGDLLVTGGVVILIYHWAQKKSGSLPASAVARSGPRGGQRGPAVPNRDYEVLNPRTRDATYAVAGVNRTG